MKARSLLFYRLPGRLGQAATEACDRLEPFDSIVKPIYSMAERTGRAPD